MRCLNYKKIIVKNLIVELSLLNSSFVLLKTENSNELIAIKASIMEVCLRRMWNSDWCEVFARDLSHGIQCNKVRACFVWQIYGPSLPFICTAEESKLNLFQHGNLPN